MNSPLNQARLSAPFGKYVNESEPVIFSFENQQFIGAKGDTLTSALLANGQWLLSRSFKYHRPRGTMTTLGHDANTLVQLPGFPNALADTLPLQSGMQVYGQNYLGSLARDKLSWLRFVSKFLPVGFYYKAFFRPRNSWEKWAKLFRKVAGLGVLDPAASSPGYDKRFSFYDVVVIGGGPAGMSAALEAAKAGVSVLLVEQQPELGGSLSYTRPDASQPDIDTLCQQLKAKVAAHSQITVLVNSVCNGWFTDNLLPIINGPRLHKVRAKQLLLCSGVIEQPVIFHNNDLPGIITVTAAQRLLRLYGVKPGREVVILTADDNGYALALDCIEVNITVSAIVDMREMPSDSALAKEVVAKGLTVVQHATVYAAHPDASKMHLGAVEIGHITGPGQCEPQGTSINCDLLCMSGGYVPTYQLACQAGGILSYDDEHHTFSLTQLPKTMAIAGSLNGAWHINDVLTDGQLAGRQAAAALSGDPLVSKRVYGAVPNIPWPIFAHPKGKEFVDFDEDLQISDILNSVADGYEHVQLVKRYSTVGMGPSQGRHSALTTARLVAKATGKSVGQTGVTTARPPFAPETIGHMAGQTRFVSKRSALTPLHQAKGASLRVNGPWVTPLYYREHSEPRQQIAHEIGRANSQWAIADNTMLGGIDVVGKDALSLLDGFYATALNTLEIGRCRHCIELNELGVVIRDLVISRLDESHFYLTLTSAAVAPTLLQLQKRQCLTQADAIIADVSSAWCKISLFGPLAHAQLQKLIPALPNEETFAAMSVRIFPNSIRVLRLSYYHQQQYELHLPQHLAKACWQYLASASPCPGWLGSRAQNAMRLERGKLAIGRDSDADSTPAELGLQNKIDLNKPNFAGKWAMTVLPAIKERRYLVSFESDVQQACFKENLLVIDNQKIIGKVTSCCISQKTNKTIGFSYIDCYFPVNKKINIKSDSGQILQATVTSIKGESEAPQETML